MKKRGFTLIELLSVIVLLSIILSIAIPPINNLIDDSKVNSFIMDEKMMVRAAKLYIDANESRLPKTIGDTVEIKLKSLEDQHLIEAIEDPWNINSLCSGYILITKTSSNSYDYNPYLRCESNYKADSYIDDGLAAYWELNNNAYDYTPNNHQGDIHNAIGGTNRFGTTNGALEFQGPGNFIDTNYDYSFNYNNGTTIMVWVKFSTIDTGGKIKNILGKSSWEYILSQIDNKIVFTQWDNKGNYATQLTSNINIVPNTWYNIAVVYNQVNKSFSLYVDGTLDILAITTATSFNNRTESLKIGRGYPEGGSASSSFFIGNIDNISIYNRALSSNEIKLYYRVDMEVNK